VGTARRPEDDGARRLDDADRAQLRVRECTERSQRWTLPSAAKRTKSAVIMMGRLRRNSTNEPRGSAIAALAMAEMAASADTWNVETSSIRTAMSGSAPAPNALPISLTE
jgi:hypothetical protein